jgi:AraC-like DNA-binding protein
MQRLVLSTDDVPEAERFAYWREGLLAGRVGLSGERNEDAAPFRAHVTAWIGAPLVRFRSRSDTYPAFRRPRDVARHAWDDYVWLYREAGAGAWFDHGGREFMTRPADLFIVDPTVPFARDSRTGYDIDLWCFPRKLFDAHLPVAQRPRSLVLTADDGLPGLVKTYLKAFANQIDKLDDNEIGSVADNFCRLLAVACGADAGEHQEAVRLARLEEARGYIHPNLADPDLSPAKTAGALKISVRQLHRMFEPSGMRFAQYVLSRRLEECRTALTNPLGGRSVTDIAFAWGYNLAQFYRTFRQAFGAAPGELRARRERG